VPEYPYSEDERVWVTYDDDGQIVMRPVPPFVPPRGLEAWYLEDGTPDPTADWVWAYDDTGEMAGLVPNVPYRSRWFWEPNRQEVTPKERREILALVSCMASSFGAAVRLKEEPVGSTLWELVGSLLPEAASGELAPSGWPPSFRSDGNPGDETLVQRVATEMVASTATILEELNADGISCLLVDISVDAECLGSAAASIRLQADAAYYEAAALACADDAAEVQFSALLRLRELARQLEAALRAIKERLVWLQSLALAVAVVTAQAVSHEFDGEPAAREHGPPPPLLSHGSSLLRHAPPRRFFNAPLDRVVRSMRVEEGCLAA
jgi:hypothetical protein